jgi:hypothetical protein
MNTYSLKILQIFLIMLVVSNILQERIAQAGEPANLSQLSITKKDKTFLDQFTEHTTLSYYGIYRGGSLANLGSPFQPNIDGTLDSSSPQVLDSSLTGGYKIPGGFLAGAIARFYLFPTLDPRGTNQKIQLMDPILFLAKPGLVNTSHFKLDGRITLQLPLSQDDALIHNHLAGALSATFNSRYEDLSGKLTLGIYGYVRGFIPTPDMMANAPTDSLAAAPYVNYKITEALTATLWVDLVQATRTRGTGFLSGLINGPIDIEPGINWDINKTFSINPILNLYPDHLTLASSSIQILMMAKAF